MAQFARRWVARREVSGRLRRVIRIQVAIDARRAESCEFIVHVASGAADADVFAG